MLVLAKSKPRCFGITDRYVIEIVNTEFLERSHTRPGNSIQQTGASALTASLRYLRAPGADWAET